MTALIVTSASATVNVPRKVQGVSYTPNISTKFDYTDPADMPGDGDFTFDMIESWTGEGENRAALVIQWNADGETTALVFGYRWDGQATGADMMRAVTEANPRLYSLMQYTNVSSPTDPLGGYTICGIGWDADNDGEISISDGTDVYSNDTGWFKHPRGYDPVSGGSIDYDYDDWFSLDEDDFWGAGWYLSYWSYWVKSSQEAQFSYSSWGASGRVLTDGCWDGWNFALNMYASSWKKFAPAPALIPEGAKTDFEVNGLHYTLKDYSKKTVVLAAPTATTGIYSGDITVPATFVDGDITYTVVAVAKEAFQNSAATSVVLPATVTSIGANAFAGSTTLTTVSVDGVNAIKTIDSGAFDGCSALTTFLLPANPTSIAARTYAGTAITAIDLPAAIKSIGDEAFADCNALTAVTVNTIYPLEIAENVFSTAAYQNATLTVPYGYTADYAAATGWGNFVNVAEKYIPVNVGDVFMYQGVTYQVLDEASVMATHCRVEGAATTSTIKAANAAYSGDLVIPASVSFQGKALAVTAIDEYAFYYAVNVTSITIEAPVTAIEQYTFDDCSAITAITLPATVQRIDKYAFAYCKKLASLTLPSALTELGERCFFYCQALTEITLPEGVTSIPNYCFSYCTALQSMSFGDQVTTLGDYVFDNCAALTSVRLPQGMAKLPNYFFRNCSALESVALPESVTAIGMAAFSGCKKLNISLPATITSIDSEAFKNCTALTEMTLPESITKVPNSLFYGCSSLTSVTYNGQITAIGNYAFYNCTSLPEANIPATVTSLGTYAFAGCKLIESVVIPEGITSIGNYDFQNCTALKSVTLPSTLKSIGNYAFSDCSALESIDLPASLTSLGTYVFKNCSGLTAIDLPAGLTTIGGYCFQGSGLKELVVPASVTSMAVTDVVYGCTDIVVYMCNPTPVKSSTNTWRIASNVYAKIVVPTGCVDAYTNFNSYWKKSEIVVPDLTSVEMLTPAAVAADQTVTITGSVKGHYALAAEETPAEAPARAAALRDALPEAFAAGCDQATLFGTTATLKYRASVDDEYTTTEVTIAADGSFSADIARPEATTLQVAIAASGVESAETEVPVTVPVTDIVLGDGSGVINIYLHDILALTPTVLPADATNTSFTVTIADESIASKYSVYAYNPSRKFYELIAQAYGTTTVTFTAADGFERTYTVNVIAPDRTPTTDRYTDGTFWLNEDWFGHANGSINYLTADGKIIYRAFQAQNADNTFGVTSQFGTIYADRLVVMSKQGPRCVIADANTLQQLAAFDEIGGDGRACVGANGKIYLGTTQGIRPLYLSDYSLGDFIEGIASSSLYSNQIGNMVAAGHYVFAMRQDTGVLIIDSDTDEYVTTLGTDVVNNPQGIAVDCNGQVWLCGTDNSDRGYLYRIDPATLEVAETVALPDGQYMEAQWSTWRSSNFFALKKSPMLIFGAEFDRKGWSGDNKYYSWTIGDVTDGVANTSLIFDFPTDLQGCDEKTMQRPYATAGFDERSNRLLIATTHGYSSAYRYTWLHTVDPATAQIVSTTQLKDYYWFPAMPIFPDKYAPQFGEMPTRLNVVIKDDIPAVLDLSELVSDPDGIDACINISVEDDNDVQTLEEGEPATALSDLVDIAIDGKVITLTHKNVEGSSAITIYAESNGRTASVNIPVLVVNDSGIADAVAQGTISYANGRLHICGMDGTDFVIFNLAGQTVGAFTAQGDNASVVLTLAPGAYVVATANGSRTIKINI
ncbi:MAG: leucine-rich repeat protein [Muribaculaceae bacterium]